MTGLPSLLGALGLVALLFAMVSFLLALFGVSTDLGWILANLGVASSTPLLDSFHRPVVQSAQEKRWSHGLYLDQPQEWDDPYRFFRW